MNINNTGTKQGNLVAVGGEHQQFSLPSNNAVSNSTVHHSISAEQNNIKKLISNVQHSFKKQALLESTPGGGTSTTAA